MHTPPLHILYEDADLIICEKPHGVPTQTKKIGMPDMASMIKNHTASPYLAVIHRLDQPVRGILVFAKTSFAAKALNRELQNSGFGKYYRALTASAPKEPQGTLENYLYKDGRTNTSHICSQNTPGARFARLSYRLVTEEPFLFLPSVKYPAASSGASNLKRPRERDLRPPRQSSRSCQHDFDPLPAGIKGTELEIRLDTGRHHQIRLQLASIGCPIIGDQKYGPSHAQSAHHATLKLCAYRLDFTHPRTNKKMNFQLIP